MTKIMKASILLGGAVLCLFGALAWGGTVYKWTDAGGQVHYGDQKPLGVKSEALNINTGQAEDTAKSGEKEEFQGPAKTAGKKTSAPGDDGGQGKLQANAAKLAAQRKHNCQLARKNLQIIRDNGRIRIEDKNGRQRYLSPAEIQAKKNEFERIAKDSCN